MGIRLTGEDKIHPYLHNWDFNDTRHMETLHSLFEYAARNNVPALIHTGPVILHLSWNPIIKYGSGITQGASGSI
jgi:predicted TIM-barrel fold metal-dependent hydrolase